MSETSGWAANMPCAGFISAESRRGDRHHDDGGNQHLDDREARLRSPRTRASFGAAGCGVCNVRLHWTFLDLIVISRASFGPARHAARIAGAAIALPRDEHLKNDHVVGIGRERLDGPPADERGVVGNDSAPAERPAAVIEIVDVAVVFACSVFSVCGDSPLPPVAAGG